MTSRSSTSGPWPLLRPREGLHVIGKVLVANRGEVALRVIRACRELGIRSVAVYSTADVDSLHRLLADNARVAEICEACNLRFVGPASSAIARMGDKAAARKFAAEAGVPVTPGSDGPCRSATEVRSVGAEVGYPLVVKASAGGGGKGMRVIYAEDDVEDAFAAASREAGAAFGDGSVYAERYMEELRHVEVQVLADGRGDVAIFPERDCSIQRRYQKLVEETPAPGLTTRARKGMRAASAALVSSLGYEGAGTVEFVCAGDEFYFIEMNTRLQVEHPVTEMTTGVDLVAEQLRVASGEV